MKEIVKKSLIWLFYILCLIIIVNYFCESFCFFENIISNNPIKRKVFYTFDFKIIYFAQISSFKKIYKKGVIHSNFITTTKKPKDYADV